jgi:molybdopterin synthase catalytic subunit
MDALQDLVELRGSALDVAGILQWVGDAEAGGVALFLGTTRSENKGTVALAALDYEAYPQMAVTQMKQLAALARSRWALRKVAIVHRTGRVAVGEPSVAIAVSAPHRGQAFEACRFLIDSLKKDVAVWKKEVWGDGSATWSAERERRD